MQLKSQGLASHLKSTLGSSYLLHGSEALLIEDSLRLIRRTAIDHGQHERLIFNQETGFDWSEFASEFNALSLFSEKKLIELRLPSAKPGVKGSEVLSELAARESDDCILLVVCPKLETATKNSKWVKHFSKHGVSIEHYPVSSAHLLSWIKHRADGYQLRIDSDASRLLAYYLEGNLLAIDQEIKKFALLAGENSVSIDLVHKSVEDSARFNIYSFVDTVLSGHLKRALRMLASLKSEDIEPVLINWALSRETRQLLQMSSELDQGASITGILKKYRVWSNRAGIVESSLKRIKLSKWQMVHQQLAHLDRLIKGRASSTMKADIWTEYERIIITLC